MKYEVDILAFGTVADFEERKDLVLVTDECEIQWVCDSIGWAENTDEEYPTALWVEVLDGEYGDIYASFSSRPWSSYEIVYHIVHGWSK